MAAIAMDVSRHPIVVITLPSVVELDEIDRHFERLEALAPRGEYVAVIDIRQGDAMRFTAAHRQRTADNLKRLRHMRRLTLGEAYVLESPVMRGMLTAIRWVIAPRWPVEHFGDLESALRWAESKVGAAPAPPVSSPSRPPSRET